MNYINSDSILKKFLITIIKNLKIKNMLKYTIIIFENLQQLIEIQLGWIKHAYSILNNKR